MIHLLGLTGSIGMGKSTTADMFRAIGIPVWDADAAVHALYGKHGAAVTTMQDAFPTAVVDGAVDRNVLKRIISEDPAALKAIETVVHPLVADDRVAFIADHPDQLVVLDMPLLFETRADVWLDAVVVVSARTDVQRARVLARPNMTPSQLDAILAKQMPDAEKRTRADYLIETTSLDAARQAVQNLVADIRKANQHA